jgi:molecular chaperone GrpE
MNQKKPEGDTTAAGSAPPNAPEDEATQPDTGRHDGAPSASTELDQLRQKLHEKEEEAHKNYDLFLRERADLENFKKRMQREKVEALRFASEPLIRELLPVVDNLERAIEHGGGNGQSVVEGIRLVLNSLHEILERHGVRRIHAVGVQFDPTVHEAMAQVESAEHEPNQVVEQHHSGYLLHERLLRPALVTVSGRKGGAGVESESNND